MLAEPLPATTAAEWGLIWQMVEDDRLMPEAQALAARLATQATAALALTKRALDAAATNPLDRQLDLERDLQAEAGASPDHREGVRAFLDKRPPVFTGRRR
jgi:2-(1,2-epoxy-1,2-dihydrophenyl)acetyl-CoA isomerase